MGNTNLLKREAEMTHLQPHLGDTRRQELRSSPFQPTLNNELRMEKSSSLKGTPKDPLGFGPYQNKPFRGPHNNKRGSYRKRPCGEQSTPSSNQFFSSGRGKLDNRCSRGRFRPHSRDEGMETSPPNDSLKASLTPPVGHLRSLRRDWQTNKCSMC